MGSTLAGKRTDRDESRRSRGRSRSEYAPLLLADLGDVADDAVDTQRQDTARRAVGAQDDPGVAAADAPLRLGLSFRCSRSRHDRTVATDPVEDNGVFEALAAAELGGVALCGLAMIAGCVRC